MSQRVSKSAARWLLVIGIVALAIVPSLSPRSARGDQKRIVYYQCDQKISLCIQKCYVPLPGGGGYFDEVCSEQCYASNCKALDCLTTCTNGSDCKGKLICPPRSCSSQAHPICSNCRCAYDKGFKGTPQDGTCGCFR